MRLREFKKVLRQLLRQPRRRPNPVTALLWAVAAGIAVMFVAAYLSRNL